jgi:hypothetical protein
MNNGQRIFARRVLGYAYEIGEQHAKRSIFTGAIQYLTADALEKDINRYLDDCPVEFAGAAVTPRLVKAAHATYLAGKSDMEEAIKAEETPGAGSAGPRQGERE